VDQYRVLHPASPAASRLPIMLGYWTAEVNSRAQRVLRNDLYSLYAQLLAALRRRPN